MTTTRPSQTIRRAIVPAAGFGTRLRPLTHAIPKEMLPLGRKPVLEWVLHELIRAGITQVLFVVSPGKEIIGRYFDDGSRWGTSCHYVVQADMKGLGDAILLSEEWLQGEAALVAFGDCVIESASDLPSARLLSCHTSHGCDAAVLTQQVPSDRVGRYGIMKPASGSDPRQSFQVSDIVEKPRPEEAPSDLAVAGRWVLGPRVFDLLRRTAPASNGELNLTDAIRLGLSEGATVWAEPLQAGEARRDIGSWESYLSAVSDYACRDEEFGESVRRSVCGDRSL